jgi:hypothetical protein
MEPDSQLSPGLLKKVVHAAARARSFREAEEDLQALAEVSVSAQRIRRAAQRIGQQRVGQSEAAVEQWRNLPIPEQLRSPGPAPPEVACVQADGGRIQIRPRAAVEHQGREERTSWWRETKVGCLLSMTSQTHPSDPAPEVPQTFVDPQRMAKITREIKGFSSPAAEEEQPSEPGDEASHEAPQVVTQTVVATRESLEPFGDRLAARAHALGFAAAPRKAFVADGAEANWSLWQRRFSHYTPVLDWVHAVCYVYESALAGVAAAEGWTTYCRWAQWLWSGQVDSIVQELSTRQQQLGAPADDDAEGSPRRLVADALRYLTNQRTRMNYPAYRRQGLPITSSHIESTIKRVNRRMKGTEKFWDQAAEPLLHLVADHLSPPDTLNEFWNNRPRTLASHRSYHSAA